MLGDFSVTALGRMFVVTPYSSSLTFRRERERAEIRFKRRALEYKKRVLKLEFSVSRFSALVSSSL